MRNIFKLVKYEIKDLLKNPGIILVVLLPIFMSKVIMSVADKKGTNFILFASWIVFAQVMVGIMVTGPNLIEEREGKTIDALLVSPLSFNQIIAAKGLTILMLSLISQMLVVIVNHGFTSNLILSLFFIFFGGILSVQIGLIIGLTVNSAKNGTAVSTVFMVILFIAASVYKTLPAWSYKFFAILPSIEIVENINSIMKGKEFLLTETTLLMVWIVVFALLIKKIGKAY